MSYATGSSQQPYRIPSGPSEGKRLLGRFKSFSRIVKLGIVGGGLLTLVAVGAMAAPLVNPEPLRHLAFGAASEPSSTARVTPKAIEPSHAAPTVKPTSTEPSRTPASTIPAAPTAEPTKVPTTKVPTTKAPEPTKAPTTKATEPVKTSTTPLPTTPKPSTTTTTPTPTKTTTSATAKPTVTPNAICTVAGATGVSATGTAMVCRTTTTDPVLRWRVVV
jgi:outer membrane biosynthesis protein TonB